MNVDLSFFDVISTVWDMFFGFFPVWFQAVMGVALALYVSILAVKLVKFLKDLLWPF